MASGSLRIHPGVWMYSLSWAEGKAVGPRRETADCGVISIYRPSEIRTNDSGRLIGAAGSVRSTRFSWGRPINFSGVATVDRLLSIEPRIGSTNVADHAVVTLVFSDPVDTNINLASAFRWTGVPDTNSIRYFWNSNATKLFCAGEPSWPLNAEIAADLVQSSFTNFYTNEFGTVTTNVSLEIAFRSLSGNPVGYGNRGFRPLSLSRSPFGSPAPSYAVGTYFSTVANTVVGQPDVESYALGRRVEAVQVGQMLFRQETPG